MIHVTANYNGSYLTPEQVSLLHASLLADLADLAAMDAEPEPEIEAEP